MAIGRQLKREVKRGVQRGLGPLVRNTGVPQSLAPERWGLKAGTGGLSLQGVALHGLLSRWGSPLHVVDVDRLLSKARKFQSGLCEVYYSYKTNPIPGVLKKLHAHGVGAEVISPYELWLAFRLGVPPEKIIYNGPARSDDSLRLAIEKDILLLNLNHREEIGRVAKLARELGKKPRVGLRVVPEGGWSGQFGIPIAGGQAMQAYAEAQATGAFDLCGIHAHLGGTIRTRGQLEGFLEQVLGLCDGLREKHGLTFRFLNFGGSLAIPTVGGLSERDLWLNRVFQKPLSPPEADACLTLAQYLESMELAVHAHFPGKELPRVLVEPGRAMTGDTQLLLASVVGTKAVVEATDYAILDAGINLAECVRHEYHQIFPVNRYGEAATHTYSLVGPICSPGDLLYYACQLPPLRPGDSLAIMDAGAYFVPFATSFSFPQPAIVALEGGREVLLRRAETFESQLSLDEGV